ncbi:MAG: hypothetical protein EOM87_05400 [Clostridia bacterium]|nr:hypothetical protein [Clostridia bacterium]
MKRKGLVILLIIMASVFGLTAAGLGIAWGVTSRQASAENRFFRSTLEDVYQKSYYELTNNLSNISSSLNKLLVSNSDNMQKQLLDEISAYSASAVTNLASVLADNTNAEKMMKYINQVGDYSAYLQYKLNQGENISDEDENIIASIYAAMLEIEKALEKVKEEVEVKGYVFLENFGKDNDVLTGMLNDLESANVQYPSLIYDGPFSEALEEREPKGLIGEDIDAEAGKQKVESYLLNHTVNSIEFLGEGTNHFAMLIYKADTEMGEAYIEIAKKGGSIISMNLPHEVDNPAYNEEECVTAADEYIAAIGYSNMSAVWVSNYNSIIYVNFAYVQNNVIIYPDLIKVKVSADNKAIVGVEALNYVYNHVTRTIGAPALTESQARNAVSTKITVESIRLAIVPVGGGKEKLTYEVYGVTNEDKYFIYVDANTGKEINILRVIDSDKGELLV